MPDVNNMVSGIFGSTALIIVASLAVSLVIIFFVFRYVRKMSGTSKEQQQVLLNGIPAQGRILAVAPTGTMINYQPVANITLEVHPMGGAPYQAQVTRIVSQFQMAQFQVGATVPVKVDPADASKVVIAL